MKKYNIQLLVAVFTPLLSYALQMPQHPMYKEFKHLSSKIDSKKRLFLPINKEKIHTSPLQCTKIEKMGCLILAGGQGTRLGYNGPKGSVILPLKEPKSLFQILFEKIKVETDHLPINKRPPLAIMTSPLNHDDTLTYLKKHNWFGVDPARISFFSQETLPICDNQGHIFYEKPNIIAHAPNGNGHTLFHFYRSNAWKQWQKKGIEVVQVMPVDNPLAQPFDKEMLEIHESLHVDLVLKCITRNDPNEKLGIIATEKNNVCIVEYSELTEELKNGREKDRLRYALGNTGLFSCTMNFIHRIQNITMPWHLARKKATQVVYQGNKWHKEEINVWKFESFIFDLFPHAQSFQIIVSPRQTCFAPLKNKTGPDSLLTVTLALEDQLHQQNL